MILKFYRQFEKLQLTTKLFKCGKKNSVIMFSFSLAMLVAVSVSREIVFDDQIHDHQYTLSNTVSLNEVDVMLSFLFQI